MHIRAPLLNLLDGRGDKVGLDPEHEIATYYLLLTTYYLLLTTYYKVGLDPEHEIAGERYAARVTIKVNTVVILTVTLTPTLTVTLTPTLTLTLR